ncbi:unnamed protein product [Mytilus edulis]|uniref:Uncharacterized protein n=1 Tax=Mytilus edulis TaxID=6550 RepID=A0A8S3QCQ9_MYTED|nr:unnamed protein product [Mytilus edulis]
MVPSVVNTPLPVDLPYEEQKTICLSYYLKECAIPPALIFKLIATAVITWPLKEIDGRPCLFSQSAILNIDVNNELLIATKDQRVILYLTNKVSRDRISPDVAASIQECLSTETLSPSNHQLVQIVNLMSLEYFRPFIIFLGLSVNKWEDILFQYRVNGLMGVKLMAMYVLKNGKGNHQSKSQIQRLVEIFGFHRDLASSPLSDTDSSTLQEIPSDEVLNLLPRKWEIALLNLDWN